MDLTDAPKRTKLPEMLRDWLLQARAHGISAVVVTVPDPRDPQLRRRKVAGAYPPTVLQALGDWDATRLTGSQTIGRTTEPEFAGTRLVEHGLLSWACWRAHMPYGVGLEVFMLSEQAELSRGAASEVGWDLSHRAGLLWRAAGDTVLHITERERTCLHSAVQGKTAEETAQELGIEATTVTYHLNNAIKKFSARGKMNAAMRALHLGSLWKSP